MQDHPQKNMKTRGQKRQLNFLSELGKIVNCSIMSLSMNWEKLCPRLSLASLLKIRWRNHIIKDDHILNLT